MGNRKDLTGQKFNRLTVIDWDSEKRKWRCKCDCGNESFTYVSSSNLTSNHTKSCGCLDKENRRKRAIERNKKMAKYCDYEVQEDYVIMYTPKGESFLVDLEDFYKIKFLSCSIDDKGYVVCKTSRKNRFGLHRFVTNAPKGMKVDHKNHDTTDNRKDNLRVVTNQQNQMNRKANKNNISGKAGVTYFKPNGKWRACICVNKKIIHLGTFDNKEDAIKARVEAENKYYGEFSYTNSTKGDKGECA